MWVRPLWAQADYNSHAFVTFKWSGLDQSYFALSQGWWEPQGARKLYVILSNQQFLSCHMPWKFDYTLFLPGQWTMLGVTWRSGTPGYVRLFVDGKQVCEGQGNFSPDRHLVDPLYLGSDRGAGVENRGRPANMVIDNVVVTERAYSAEEIHREYAKNGGAARDKWMSAITSAAAGGNFTHERRMMLDEDTGWASSRGEIRSRIARLKSAGFNIYAPCVWDGGHSYFLAPNAPVSVTIHDVTDASYDPLSYLIELAHSEGIEVHPWIYVAHRTSADFPPSYFDGAPENAFNVQSEEFRNFIVALTLAVAANYDVDGINLDYVRAIGPCSTKNCIDTYHRIYGRSIQQDWNLQEQGQTVPSLIEWNRKAIGDIIYRISSGVRKSKPRAVLTIDTVPFDHGREHQGLDEDTWLRHGVIDALVDMAYDDPLDLDNLDGAVRSWSAARQIIAVRNYDIFGDTITDRSGLQMADYVQLVRARWPGAGIAFYHYPHLDSNQVVELRRNVFSVSATPNWAH